MTPQAAELACQPGSLGVGGKARHKCTSHGEGTPPPSKPLQPGTHYVGGKKLWNLLWVQGRVLAHFLLLIKTDSHYPFRDVTASL